MDMYGMAALLLLMANFLIDLNKASADPISNGYYNIVIYRSNYSVPIDVNVENYDTPSDDYVG